MQRRAKTSIKIHKATMKLEVIRSDLVGPYTDGYGGRKYFVIFIDEYFKYTCVYVMKTKSEALDKFRQYVRLNENEMSSINCPQSTRTKILRL